MFARLLHRPPLVAMLLGLLGCAHSPRLGTADLCDLPSAPEILEQSPTELHQVWDVAESPRFLQPVPADAIDPILATYQQAVRARTDVDPLGLIRRQRGVFLASQNPALHAETRVSGALLDGKIGQLGAISCLDMRLWAVQATRRPMLTEPSEFTAFVLRGRSPARSRLRIYFSSFPRSGGRMNQTVRARVDADLGAGYVLMAHLHNHPFLFDRVVGDASWTRADTKDDIAGAVPPSVTDLQYYSGLLDEAGLQSVRITNGFITLMQSPAEIRTLSAAGRASP